MDLQEIIETFELLDDWEERYRFLIDLGRKLEPLPDDAYSDENKVRGCQSQVWLIAEARNNGETRLHFRGDSDAFIVKGLIAVLLVIFSDRTPTEILATDAREILNKLGLAKHLSPLRTNGLFSMVERVNTIANSEVSNS